MTSPDPEPSFEPAAHPVDRASQRRVWLGVICVALPILFALDYLLGLVIWLPLYSGLFGFLVAGLIAGGASFRLARRLRPVAKGKIWTMALMITLLNAPVSLYFEYHHVLNGVADLKGFGKLRNRAFKEGRPRNEVIRQIEVEYRNKLHSENPPGGFIGYARWCIRSGEMGLQVEEARDVVSVSHRGWVWVVRSLVGMVLVFVGLCFSFDGLRSTTPIRNVLAPGEEYEDIDD